MHSSSLMVFYVDWVQHNLKNKLWPFFFKMIGIYTGVILQFLSNTITGHWILKSRDPKSIFQVQWHLSGIKSFISLQRSVASAASWSPLLM